MLNDNGFRLLVQGIATNALLEDVHFRDHGFGRDGIAALSEALRVNRTVTTVGIYGTGDKQDEVYTALHQLQQDISNRSPTVDVTYE